MDALSKSLQNNQLLLDTTSTPQNIQKETTLPTSPTQQDLPEQDSLQHRADQLLQNPIQQTDLAHSTNPPFDTTQKQNAVLQLQQLITNLPLDEVINDLAETAFTYHLEAKESAFMSTTMSTELSHIATMHDLDALKQNLSHQLQEIASKIKDAAHQRNQIIDEMKHVNVIGDRHKQERMLFQEIAQLGLVRHDIQRKFDTIQKIYETKEQFALSDDLTEIRQFFEHAQTRSEANLHIYDSRISAIQAVQNHQDLTNVDLKDIQFWLSTAQEIKDNTSKNQ